MVVSQCSIFLFYMIALDFAAGKLDLEALAACGIELGEPATLSGKQECYEALINQYI